MNVAEMQTENDQSWCSNQNSFALMTELSPSPFSRGRRAHLQWLGQFLNEQHANIQESVDQERLFLTHTVTTVTTTW